MLSVSLPSLATPFQKALTMESAWRMEGSASSRLCTCVDDGLPGLRANKHFDFCQPVTLR